METDPGVVHWHIRSLPEFENFLRAPSEDKIMRLAEKGTIIIFNVSDIRSDAFDVTKKGIRLVPLPSLKLDCLNEHAERFWRAIEETDLNELRKAKDQVNEVLNWLWDIAANPVLAMRDDEFARV